MLFDMRWGWKCFGPQQYIKKLKKEKKMSLTMFDAVAVSDRASTLPARLTIPVIQWCCCASCLASLNSNIENLELIYLHDCVVDRSGGSNRCLNVTFYNRPTDRGRNNKTLVQERASDCLLSLFISLCKHCCARENMWMQGYIFLSCHGLLKLIAGVTPSQARSQTAGAEQRQHLWWNNKLKKLWCCTTVSGWFQLLFKSGLLWPLSLN